MIATKIIKSTAMTRKLIAEFAQAIGIPEEVLLGDDRAHRLDNARQLLWWKLKINGYPATWIAELCNRSHGAVSQGIKRVAGLLATGDPLVTQWYEKTKDITPTNTSNMSEKKHTIEVSPPPYIEQSRDFETQTIKGFTCPRCSGHGHFLPKETGKGQYEKVECLLCRGTGRLDADILIQWVSSRRDENEEEYND
jgi:hypothetical protein